MYKKIYSNSLQCYFNLYNNAHMSVIMDNILLKIVLYIHMIKHVLNTLRQGNLSNYHNKNTIFF